VIEIEKKQTRGIDFYIPLFLVFYVGIEFVLKLFDSGCQTEGCLATAELVKIPEIAVVALGLFYATVLFVLSALRREKLFSVWLFVGIVFETMIFSFQLKNDVFCIFCFGFWSFLFILAILKLKEMLLLFGVLGAVIFGNMILQEKHQTITFKEPLTLLGSESCPRCEAVKVYFKENDIPYTYIDIDKENANAFFGMFEWNSIPVLIKKENNSITILKGDKTIIGSFDVNKKEVKVLDKTIIKSTDSFISNPLNTTIFNKTDNDKCTTETEECKVK
jgi:glutaredoxin